MKKLLLFSCMLLSNVIYAQSDLYSQVKPIVDEGKQLYQSEMASWYGTDLFLERYPEQTKIGGYFSYINNQTPTCIFFSNAATAMVIGTITFDSTYNLLKAKVDLKERSFTETEKNYYAIRQEAFKLLQTDTLFKVYKNTNLNLVPLIRNNERKVYVLTGPQKSGVVIFGNDYEISFNTDNKITGRKQLHQNIIPIEYGKETEEQAIIEGTVHTHLPETGDFITATDICTLMLYEKYAGWKRHNVVSQKYLNMWNCITNELSVVPMDAIRKTSQPGLENTDKKKNQ